MADTTSNRPPPAPREGHLVLSYLKKLESWLKSNTALPGDGILSTQTPTGRTFNVQNKYVNPPPFFLTKAGGLSVRHAAGQVFHSDITDDSACATEISSGTVTCSNNATTKIYLAIPLASTTFSGSMSIYQLNGTITVNSAASVPTNTFDSDGITNGDLYVEIGSVVAASGAITSITQTLETDFVCWETAYTWDSNAVSGASDPYVHESDFPDGSTTNDILYWDQSTTEWKVLAAPSTSGNFYLKVESGTLKWQSAGGC